MLGTMFDQLWFLVWLALRCLLPDILEHCKVDRYLREVCKRMELLIKSTPDLKLILRLRLKPTSDGQLSQALGAESVATWNAQRFLLFSIILTEADGAGKKLIFAITFLTLPL